MEKIRKLLLENKAWAKSKIDINAEYFVNMAKDQTPDYLWIGCSDSRIPESEVTNSNPGEIFVHRNIANLVIASDLNFLSVLSYAVEVLKVQHVIVCGHYNCGGVRAALSQSDFGLINNWVSAIKDVSFKYDSELTKITNLSEKTNKLVEFSVREQIRNLSKTAIVQKAWHERKLPHLHGWVYDIENGTLKEIEYLSPETVVDSAHKYTF
jgi:carbonic anhydrase